MIPMLGTDRSMTIKLNVDYVARLDVYISANTDFTRSYVEKLVDGGLCKINGRVASKSGIKLKSGDFIELVVPEPVNKIEKKDIYFEIIYEDADIAVINKPQGLTVHPAGNNFDNTLVNGLMFRLDHLSGINGVIRPGIVHRLDKDTSGVMIIAKNDKAHLSLSQQIADRTVKKRYVALLEGNLSDDSGIIKTKIGRNPKNRQQMAVTFDGKDAVTEYRVIERFKDNCFVMFNLHTGRTHQIRVHAKYLGHPVVGDPVYGFKKQKFNLKGQLLHSYSLTVKHPVTEKEMTFTAPIPDYFVDVYNILANQNNKESFEQNIVDKYLQM